MKKTIDFSKLLDNKRAVKVISVLIAVITWFIIAMAVDTDSKTVISNVPLNFSMRGSIPESVGLSVISSDIDEIDITVSGKRFKLGNLTEMDFTASIVWGALTEPGEYELPIVVRKNASSDFDYDVESFSRANVTVELDFMSTETFPVTGVADRVTAAEGFIKEATTADPSLLTLRGPKNEIDKIAKIAVETKESLVASDTVILPGSLVFYDAENNPIMLKNVTYTQETFNVTVSVFKRKMIPVTVSFVNVPPGIDPARMEYTLTQTAIEVSGPRSVIDNTESITLGEIDFRKIALDSVFSFEVPLPTGLMNINNVQEVSVIFQSSFWNSAELSVKNIFARNVPANKDIRIETTSINGVHIVGDRDDIMNLSSLDLVAIIDFQNIDISEGTSRYPVAIYATGNKFVWAVGEYSVVAHVTQK